MARGRITKRSVDALKPRERADTYLWDSELPGFGLKHTPAGGRTYLVQYRIGGRKGRTRRVTLGRHGALTPDEARREAKRVLGQVAAGDDPAENRTRTRKAPSVAELADRYLQEHVAAHNKASTAAEVRRIVESRIKPALGRIPVTALSRSRVKAWHQAMSATPYEANRALAYFSSMLSLAAKDWELRPDNPCIGIKRFRENKRERFFSDDELRRIGVALGKAQQTNAELPGVINAVRLLAVMGCRLGEVLSLRWEDVDTQAGVIRLADAKAGARTVPLGAPALALLANMERNGEYVLHGPDPDRPLSRNTLHGAWYRLRDKAGIPDARLHDFRHTMGTYAGQAGLNAFMVRDLLGHKTLAMTGRYVERATDPMRAAADTVSGRVAAALDGKTGAEVVPIPSQKA